MVKECGLYTLWRDLLLVKGAHWTEDSEVCWNVISERWFLFLYPVCGGVRCPVTTNPGLHGGSARRPPLPPSAMDTLSSPWIVNQSSQSVGTKDLSETTSQSTDLSCWATEKFIRLSWLHPALHWGQLNSLHQAGWGTDFYLDRNWLGVEWNIS